MKQILLSVLFCLSVTFLSACAAQQDEPPMPDAQRSDTTSREQMAEAPETVVPPSPKEHDDPGREYFILPSDTSRITQDGSTVWLMVRGPLANGCQRHEYYDSVSQGTTLYLTFWGSRPTDSTVVCTEQVQGYDREIRIEDSPYTRFSVIQPDGQTRSYTLSASQLSEK